MSEKQVLSGASANGSGDVFSRTGSYSITATFKFSKTNTGTATLTLHDARTDAEVASLSIASENPDHKATDFILPAAYYAKLSSVSGTLSLDAWVDGDA